MEPVKVNNKELEEEIKSGNPYIQVGEQKYLLMEVNEIYKHEYYEVTNPEEEKALQKALNEENPILPKEEAKKYLGIDR